MKKIIGILVVTLFIAATVLPVAGSINAQLKEERRVLTPEMPSEGMSAELCFSPQSYDFGPVLEGMRLRTHFEIWNCGRLPSSLEWHLGIVDPEISPSPMNGQSSGERDTVTLDISTSGLTLGEYEFAVSIFSNVGDGQFNVRFEVVDNLPPNKPDKPSGEKDGKTGTSYPYITSTIDLDGDNVKYGWDWDGNDIADEWTGFYSSSTTISTSHSWGSDGTYNVKVMAEDIHGVQSEWSDPLSVSMPKNKAVNLVQLNVLQPKDGVLYIQDTLMPILPRGTIIVGKITVVASAISLQIMDKIEFYVDDVLKHTEENRLSWLYVPWIWDDTIFFKHTLKVVAYDKGENIASEEIDVWIFNI